MVMRETIGSLKAYFILIALIGAAQSAFLLFKSQGIFIIIIFSLLGLGVSCVYFYIGISFRKLLIQSPKFITTVILISMGLLIASFLLSLLEGLQGSMVLELVIGLLITWYLLRNVKRLSSEEQSIRIEEKQ